MKFTIASLSLIISSASAACSLGQYDNNGCLDCTAGTYANTTTATSCTTCPTGTYSLAKASSCTDCGTGTTQYDLSTGNVNSASCETGCQAGYSWSNNACTVCSAGTYTSNVTESNNLWSSHACSSCPTGYWTDGTNPSSSCVEMCAANYESTDSSTCTACRTGTESSASLISAATCVCTIGNDANGCYGNGVCGSSDNGNVCTCSDNWTGTFCNEFKATVETAETTVAMDVATNTAWSDDFLNTSSTAYTTLASTVETAARTTFEASAADGYVLKSVTVTLSQDTSTGSRKRRNTGNVKATTSLVVQHAKTETADTINTFVKSEVTSSTAFTSAGLTADTTSINITDSTDSSVSGGLTDGQIIGIVIGVCGAVLLAFILFMIFAK